MTAAQLVRSACSEDPRRALELLAADPALARHDIAAACVSGEADALARLLASDPGAAQRPSPPLGHAPILYACFSRLPRIDPQRIAGVRAVVARLLEAGADPNASFDHEGWLQVPLYGAAGILNDAPLTRALIAAGADPNDTRVDDEHSVGEALYHACEFPDPACAALLIDAGTRPHVVEHCLGRALNFPHPEMVEMFCAHGARASGAHLLQAAWRRRPPRTPAALLNAGAPLEERDEAGLSALRIAVRWGQQETVELLLERGADPAQITAEDRRLGAYLSGDSLAPATPDGLDAMLDLAVQQGELALVTLLLDAGASVEGQLGQAAWRGHAEVVRELIRRGARREWEDGSAIGAARHGSRHCHHPEGGPTMRTVEEVAKERYAATVAVLKASA